MGTPEYHAFLRSVEWQVIRYNALRKAGKKCEGCQSPFRLQVHHLTYKRFGGKELPQDLMVLCEPCHRAYHNLPLLAGTKARPAKARAIVRARTEEKRTEGWKKKHRRKPAEPFKQDLTTRRRPKP